MKKISFYILLALFLSAVTVGCGDAKTDQRISAAQEKLEAEANRQSGLPNIVNFNMKKTYKMILEECDKQNLILYAYKENVYTGKFLFLGKCIGYPIPFATQYTSPEKPAMSNGYPREFSVPQADPTGLFSPTSAEGTWLQLINETTGKVAPFYCEPKVAVYAYPLPDRLVQQ